MSSIKIVPAFENHERFLSKIKVINGCWDWLASSNNKGTPVFVINGVAISARRVSYSIFINPSSTSYLESTCGNQNCVNPDHLIERTEDTKRRMAKTLQSGILSFNGYKESCPKGHYTTVQILKLVIIKMV